MIHLNCILMVCDSTYIFNEKYENREDTKIEVLLNTPDEVFIDTKIFAVFSFFIQDIGLIVE